MYILGLRKGANNHEEIRLSAVMSFNKFSEHYKKVVSGEIRPFEPMKQLGISKSIYYRYFKRIKEQDIPVSIVGLYGLL